MNLTMLEDLTEIKEYIQKDSVYYANKTVIDIYKKIENLKLFPSMGRYIPEIDSKEIRELIYKSYRIIYKFDSENIYILRVVHHARDISIIKI